MNEQETQHFAHLARIGVSPTELPALTDHLNNLMKLIAEMQKVSTDHVEPMSHPLTPEPHAREDSVSEIDHSKKFLKLAPATQAGLYLVPKVIDQEDAG